MRFSAPVSTGAIYTLLVDILGRQASIAQRDTAVALWLADVCNVDASSILDVFQYDKDARAASLDMHDCLDVVVRASSMSTEMLKQTADVWDVGTGGHCFDPKKEKPLCECPKCRGLADESPICLYNDLTDQGRMLSAWAPLLENIQYWDKPYSAYQLFSELKQSQTRGVAAQRQEHEEKRGTSQSQKQSKNIREKYGHKW